MVEDKDGMEVVKPPALGERWGGGLEQGKGMVEDK